MTNDATFYELPRIGTVEITTKVEITANYTYVRQDDWQFRTMKMDENETWIFQTRHDSWYNWHLQGSYPGYEQGHYPNRWEAEKALMSVAGGFLWVAAGLIGEGGG